MTALRSISFAQFSKRHQAWQKRNPLIDKAMPPCRFFLADCADHCEYGMANMICIHKKDGHDVRDAGGAP
jgi:hypothetical protein